MCVYIFISFILFQLFLSNIPGTTIPASLPSIPPFLIFLLQIFLAWGVTFSVLCPLSPFIGILPLTFLAAGCALPFLIPAFTHFKHQLPDASRISQYSFSLFYFFSSASFSCCWALQLTAFLLLLLSAAPGCTEL